MLGVLDGAVLVVSRGRGRAGADARADARAAAAADPDADVRQQDRPARRRSRRACCARSREAQPGRGRLGRRPAAGRGARRPRRRGARGLRRRRAAVGARICAARWPRRRGRRRCTPCSSARRARATGVDELVDGITELLPAAAADGDGPPSGSVFKIERGPAGEKVAYVRMFSGAIRTRDRLGDAKVTAISVFDGRRVRAPRGGRSRARSASCGASPDVRIGDAIGAAKRGQTAFTGSLRRRSRPSSCRGRRTDRRALRVALDQLAEQDPLIDVRQDEPASCRSRSTARCRRRSSRPRWRPTSASPSRSASRPRSASSGCAARRGVRADRRGRQPVPRHRRAARRARRRPAAGVASGSRSSSARCRCRSSRRSRRRCRATLEQGTAAGACRTAR